MLKNSFNIDFFNVYKFIINIIILIYFFNLFYNFRFY